MADPKSVAATLYEERIRDLPLQVRLHLSHIILLGAGLGTAARDLGARGARQTRSLLELEGLGASLWQDLDAQEHVDRLRSEWDHRP